MVRTHNLHALLPLGTAIFVALLFLRDRQAAVLDGPVRGADVLVLRHPLRVPLRVGSPSIDEIASETRPVLLAEDNRDWGREAASRSTGPQLAPDYRPLDEEWSADPLSATSGSPREQPTRRLIPAPAWSPAPQRVREHRVVEGDTLKRIAERYLGDAERWLELFSLNRQVLASPEVLPIGTVLQLLPRRGDPKSRHATDDWQVDLVPLD